MPLGSLSASVLPVFYETWDPRREHWQTSDAVGDRYTIMWRQKATDVVFAHDMAPIRKHLEEGMRILEGCYVQIVLRELQTLNGRQDRLHDWVSVAKEVAEKFA